MLVALAVTLVLIEVVIATVVVVVEKVDGERSGDDYRVSLQQLWVGTLGRHW